MKTDKIKEPTMHRKTLLTLQLLIALASPVLAEDDKALLAKCDFNNNGTIDTAEMYGITTRAAFRTADPKIREAVKNEQNCKMDYDLAKGKEESARLDDEYKKMIQILALLSPSQARTYLADEIQKIGKEISEGKAANHPARVKPLEHRLNILRTEQQKLK